MAAKTRLAIERFAEKIRHTDSGCWQWTAYCGTNGYGRFFLNGKNVLAHRWSYEHYVGPIPTGLQIDHLCRNRGCVNPDHMEPVTASVNVTRSTAPAVARQRYRSMTQCRRGHDYDEANTRIDGNGGRVCLACKRMKAREHYEKNRAVYIDKARAWQARNPDRAREVTREAQRRYRARKKAA